MQDFNSYLNNEKNKKSSNNEINLDAMSTLQSLAQKYEGASESDLIKAILKEAEKGRANGTLSDADIDNFAKMLLPMLNGKQRETLEKVVARLKKKG